MKLQNKTLGFTALGVALGTALSAQAVDITIQDKINPNAIFGVDGRGIAEDGETELGTVSNQSWDLEAFVVQGGMLHMIGGFDFKNGQQGFLSGDIFIDTDNDALYPGPTLPGGNGYQAIDNINYKYNYVIDLDFSVANPTYNVINLNDASAQLLSGYYRQNDEANPYRWVSGGTAIGASGLIGYTTGLTDAQVLANYGVSLLGGTHNVVSVPLGWFPSSTPADLIKFTMACSNDSLVGQLGDSNIVPDGGATLALLGLGLGSLLVSRRRNS